MTYIEMLLLIQENKETVVLERAFAIQTDKHLYTSHHNGDWQQRELPVYELPFLPLTNGKKT